MVYNETTLQQTAAICTSPNGDGDGVWMSGAGLPIDTVTANGRIFFVTGNGDMTSYPPLTNSVDYGMSILRYDLSNGGLTISDAFTIYNQEALANADLDQGSGGILLLPNQSGTYPHELIQVGKEGRISSSTVTILAGTLVPTLAPTPMPCRILVARSDQGQIRDCGALRPTGTTMSTCGRRTIP